MSYTYIFACFKMKSNILKAGYKGILLTKTSTLNLKLRNIFFQYSQHTWTTLMWQVYLGDIQN